MSAGVRRCVPPPLAGTLDLGDGLFLSPRLKLLLSLFRSDPAVKPIDEWRIRLSLLEFLRSSLSLSVADGDLVIAKSPALYKRKRCDPVATGALFVRDLVFLEGGGGDRELDRRRFLDWRGSIVDRLDGIDLNIEGVGFRMSVEVPISDDFERMKKSWEDLDVLQSPEDRTSSRSASRRPNTVVIRGIPSRWLAEPRVSSKPSMLVTHTVFSVLGAIRKLNVAEDDDLVRKLEEKEEIVSGLQCKVWIQFDNYNDFCNAMETLCGRSMEKQGSRLKVDYVVNWDRDGFFQNVTPRSYMQERGGKMQVPTVNTKYEAPRHRPRVTRFDSDTAPTKRFRD